MKIKFKKLHKNAVLPVYAKYGDAGMDMTAVSYNYPARGNYIEYKTGLSVEIPEGYVGLLFPRSSISKMELSLANSVGVLDSGYRGEVSFRFKEDPTCISETLIKYRIGDRIGQLIILPYPTITPEWSETLSDSERGQDAYGSSGK